MLKNTEDKLTFYYAAVQAGFWMTWCSAVSYAAVYLQGLGYRNAELGLITAAGSLCGALLGTSLSDWIDRQPRVTADRLALPVLLAQAAALVLLLFFPVKGAVSAVGFALYMSFSASVNSLNLKLYSDAAYRGTAINYGFARGMGSLFYVFASLILGFAVERTSVRAVPVAGLLLFVWQLAAFLCFRRHLPPAQTSSGGSTAKGSPLPVFIRKNRRFCVLLLGTVLIFFAHNVVSSYMINITRNVGGDTSTMGLLNGFMAAVEIPVLVFSSALFSKRSNASLLRVAFVFFALKAAAIALATSVPLLGAAFLLQAPSYALYTAAIVPYVARVVAYEDSAKAQSLAFTMTTLGGVLANILGGWMFDGLSVKNVLWIACAVSVLGAAVAVSGVQSRTVKK